MIEQEQYAGISNGEAYLRSMRDDEVQFLKNTMGFGRNAAFIAGTIGSVASVSCHIAGFRVGTYLYAAAAVILFSAAFLLHRRLKRLS